MRITIIGINYAPEVTGIAPYTTGMAEGLAARGHDVTVLTGLPHYPEWRIASGYSEVRRSRETSHGVDVRRFRHYVPTEPSSLGRVRMEASFARAVAAGDWNDPQVVVTVSPALLAAASVVGAARARRVPVGVVVQDLYGKAVVETGAMGDKLGKATSRLESTVLRSANAVAIIHSRFADALSEIGVEREKLTVIRNWTHISGPNADNDTSVVRARFGWKPDEVIVMHAGNMGVKQGLENVVAAAKLASSVPDGARRVRFVLVGDGNQRRILTQMAAGIPAIDLVEPLEADDFPAVLAAADILLVNERPGVCDMAVPSKLTSYFIAGKPIIAATDPASGSADELRAAGAGLTVAPGQPQALLDAVCKIDADADAKQRLGLHGEKYAREVLSALSAIESYERWCFDMLRHEQRQIAS